MATALEHSFIGCRRTDLAGGRIDMTLMASESANVESMIQRLNLRAQ
jgi:hypothetical protein